jgi:hypothetical protein
VILPYIEQTNLFNAMINNNSYVANVKVPVYLCPSRSHTPFSTSGGSGAGGNNNGELGAPHTDYATAWNTFTNTNQNNFILNLTTISNGNGTAYTIFVGEKSMDPNQYGNTACNNWDECVFSGSYGGTGRGGSLLLADLPGDNYGNDWGSAHPGAALFNFCDGSVRPITYSLSGSNMFIAAQYYLSGYPGFNF